MIKKQQGFTLIELLVVIAIIGILASIVLVSFPSATKKAKDSRVKSAVSQARTVMTYYYGNNGTYVNFATTNTDMVPLAKEIYNNSYGKADLQIANSATGSCMYAVLNEKDGASYYCADSSGAAGVTTSITNCFNNTTLLTCGSPLTD